jgi:hypothetical protein
MVLLNLNGKQRIESCHVNLYTYGYEYDLLLHALQTPSTGQEILVSHATVSIDGPSHS